MFCILVFIFGMAPVCLFALSVCCGGGGGGGCGGVDWAAVAAAAASDVFPLLDSRQILLIDCEFSRPKQLKKFKLFPDVSFALFE